MSQLTKSAVGALLLCAIARTALADPEISVKLNDAELQSGAVIESIDDVLITTNESSAATLSGRLSAKETDQLDMAKISLPILSPMYLGLTVGQENFRLAEDNCTTKQLAPGTAEGATCDVTLVPRATKPGFFTGKLQVKAGAYETEIPLSGQARNFCEPEPAIVMTSSCSQACGGGTQTTTFTDGCGQTWTDTAVCNEQACDAYNWNTSQYGNCSEVCNGGIQFRDVWCESFSDGAKVADSFCEEDIKPAGSAQCNTMTCYRDYKVCGWIPDVPAELAYRGYRLQVVDEDNPDAYRYVSFTCEPDINESTPIEKSGSGCELVHFDYDNDLYSNGGAKWIISETGEVLTNCLEDTDDKLPWDLEPAGWDENDPELNARQKRQYVLNLPEKKLPMTFPKVFDGEPTVDYVKVSNDEAGVDEFEYGTDDPCEKYQKTKVIDIYERPDGSLYQKQSDDYGEPVLVDENVCTYNNVTVASAWTKYRTHHGGSWSASWYYADVVVTREDGEVVKTERLDARTQHERYGGSYEVWCNNTIWCSTSHIPPMSDAIANSYGSGAGYPWPQQ